MNGGDRGFSPAGYRSLIRAGAEAGYRFVTFGDIADETATMAVTNRLCLMRHDVDVNVTFALDLARIEAEEGIRSTYFMMLRSPAYNLLGRATSQAVRQIAGLGHEIGVHFDAQHPFVENENLIGLVLDEARIIGDLVGRPVRAVSFHQPSAMIMSSDIAVPGLINTYNRGQLAGWHYVSDSNRNWRGQDPWTLLSAHAHPHIQILTHPMWWISAATSTEAVWDEAVLMNYDTMQRQFLDTEAAYGSRRALRVSRQDQAFDERR